MINGANNHDEKILKILFYGVFILFSFSVLHKVSSLKIGFGLGTWDNFIIIEMLLLVAILLLAVIFEILGLVKSFPKETIIILWVVFFIATLYIFLLYLVMWICYKLGNSTDAFLSIWWTMIVPLTSWILSFLNDNVKIYIRIKKTNPSMRRLSNWLSFIFPISTCWFILLQIVGSWNNLDYMHVDVEILEWIFLGTICVLTFIPMILTKIEENFVCSGVSNIKKENSKIMKWLLSKLDEKI